MKIFLSSIWCHQTSRHLISEKKEEWVGWERRLEIDRQCSRNKRVSMRILLYKIFSFLVFLIPLMHSNWLGNLCVPITIFLCWLAVSCFIMIGPDGHEKPIKTVRLSLLFSPLFREFICKKKRGGGNNFFTCFYVKNVVTLDGNSCS